MGQTSSQAQQFEQENLAIPTSSQVQHSEQEILATPISGDNEEILAHGAKAANKKRKRKTRTSADRKDLSLPEMPGKKTKRYASNSEAERTNSFNGTLGMAARTLDNQQNQGASPSTETAKPQSNSIRNGVDNAMDSVMGKSKRTWAAINGTPNREHGNTLQTAVQELRKKKRKRSSENEVVDKSKKDAAIQSSEKGKMTVVSQDLVRTSSPRYSALDSAENTAQTQNGSDLRSGLQIPHNYDHFSSSMSGQIQPPSSPPAVAHVSRVDSDDRSNGPKQPGDINHGRGKDTLPSPRSDDLDKYSHRSLDRGAARQSIHSSSEQFRGRPHEEDGFVITPPCILHTGPDKGPWTEEEKDVVQQVFAEVCRVMAIDEAQLAENVAAWENVQHFKTCLQAALPMRNWTSVRKFCQRQYRRGTRGPWSAREDEIVLKMFAVNGPKWAKIAPLVDRTPDDCRDRYTKILQYGEERDTGTWSREDCQQLFTAVEACVRKATDSKGKSTPDTMDQMINWEVVSQNLNGRRSAKRCREKWQNLKEKGFEDQYAERDWKEDQSRIFWRHGASERKAQHLKDGDHFDILTEIHSSFSNPSHTFALEQAFWARVAIHNRESRFDKRLRRHVFYQLLEDNKDPEVENTPSKAMKALVMAKNIKRRAKQTGQGLQRQSADVYEKQSSKKSSRSSGRSSIGNKRSLTEARSKEIVDDSDDNQENDDDSDDDDPNEEAEMNNGDREQQSNTSSDSDESEQTSEGEDFIKAKADPHRDQSSAAENRKEASGVSEKLESDMLDDFLSGTHTSSPRSSEKAKKRRSYGKRQPAY